MSPEMMRFFMKEDFGKNPELATDIWSFGCIALDLLDGVNGDRRRKLVSKGADSVPNEEAVDENTTLERYSYLYSIGYAPFVHSSIWINVNGAGGNGINLAHCIERCFAICGKERITADQLLYELLTTKQAPSTILKQVDAATSRLNHLATESKIRRLFHCCWWANDVVKRETILETFDPTLSFVWRFPLPTNVVPVSPVSTRSLSGFIIDTPVLAGNGEIILEIPDAKNSFKNIIAWNVATASLRIVGSWHSHYEPMQLLPKRLLPIAVGTNLYFWLGRKLQKLCLIRGTLSREDLRYKDDTGEIVYGTRIENLLIYGYLTRVRSSCSLRFHCLDTVTDRWNNICIPKLNNVREKFAIVKLDHHLYLLGGREPLKNPSELRERCESKYALAALSDGSKASFMAHEL
ncbi:uncharacterized protein LOC129601579 isoform X2 [Paramacrobiotus metropolitanus]|uniref:uncharacterized protein LOC129601579 isoform X2 n=1 Tax=Paramacrobiotus metropolitanus TaxID=2943436 RepID=UPI002445773F|nr:uncharacterized protein LOC129601579 isoform X2 [Paramacrobiotus metropolitanus]